MSVQEPSERTRDVVIRASGIRKTFPIGKTLLGRPKSRVVAVSGVDLAVARGETLGIIGESGSGKTTLGRILAKLLEPDEGTLHVDGKDVTRLKGKHVKAFRRKLQVVFQDPYGSLDPTKTVADAVAEPLVIHGLASHDQAIEQAGDLLANVSLDPKLGRRFPRQLSGGQRQRVAIARAMALHPEILIADEPTSALDLSTRSGILNVLLDLQKENNLSIVMISHDFATIRHMAHSVVVMYLGRIVEEARTDRLVANPLHPYTSSLLSAVPVADPVQQRARTRIVLTGDIPNPADPPSGCAFRLLCPSALDVCSRKVPPFEAAAPDHRVACLKYGDAEYAAEAKASQSV